jgi:hypothetical protein
MGESRRTLYIRLFGDTLGPVSPTVDTFEAFRVSAAATLHGIRTRCSGLSVSAPPPVHLPCLPRDSHSLTGLASKAMLVLIPSMKLTKVRHRLISAPCPLI